MQTKSQKEVLTRNKSEEMYLKEFDAIRNVDLNVCHVPSFKAFKKLDIYAHT